MAPAYDPDATALFLRMSVQPDEVRKSIYNAYILALKSSAVWPLLAADYLMAAHDAQAARLNIIGPAYDLVATASPTFTIDRGYMMDGISSYLSTGLNPTIEAKTLVTSMHMSLFNRTNGGLGGAVDMGGRDAGNTAQSLIIVRNSTDEVDFTINTGSTRNKVAGIVDGRGSWLVNRRANGRQDVYKEGLMLPNGTALNFVALTNRVIIIGGVNTNNVPGAFAPREYSAAGIGAGLSDQQILDYHNARAAFLIAVGAKAP